MYFQQSISNWSNTFVFKKAGLCSSKHKEIWYKRLNKCFKVSSKVQSCFSS